MKQFLFSESHLKAIIAESIREAQSVSLDVQDWGTELIRRINKEIFAQKPVKGRNNDKIYWLSFDFFVPNKPKLKVNAIVHDFQTKKELIKFLINKREPICSYSRDKLKRHSIKIELLSVNHVIDATKLDNLIYHELQHFNQYSSGMEGSYFKGNLMPGAVHEIEKWFETNDRRKKDFLSILKYNVALLIYYANTMEQSAFLQTAFVQIKKSFPQSFTDAVTFFKTNRNEYSSKSSENVLFGFIKNELLTKTEFYMGTSFLNKLLNILSPHKKKIDEIIMGKGQTKIQVNSEWLLKYGKNALARSQKNSERMIVFLVEQLKKLPEWRNFVTELNRLRLTNNIAGN